MLTEELAVAEVKEDVESLPRIESSWARSTLTRGDETGVGAGEAAAEEYKPRNCMGCERSCTQDGRQAK